MNARIGVAHALALGVVLGTMSGTARAEQPAGGSAEPPSGLGLTIAGSVLLGLGVLNLATAPLCRVDEMIPDKDTQDICLYGSLIGGGAMVVVGTPLLIVGLGQRSKHKRWEGGQVGRGTVWSGLRIAAASNRVGVGFTASF